MLLRFDSTVGWLNHLGSKAQAKPNQFNESDQANPKTETQKTSNWRKEANPSLARLTNILKHRWLIKENMQNSYIFFVGIVAGFQSAKMNRISIEQFLYECPNGSKLFLLKTIKIWREDFAFGLQIKFVHFKNVQWSVLKN